MLVKGLFIGGQSFPAMSRLSFYVFVRLRRFHHPYHQLTTPTNTTSHPIGVAGCVCVSPFHTPIAHHGWHRWRQRRRRALGYG